MICNGGVTVAVSVTAFADMSGISSVSTSGFCDFDRKDVAFRFNSKRVRISAAAGVIGSSVFGAGGGYGCFNINVFEFVRVFGIRSSARTDIIGKAFGSAGGGLAGADKIDVFGLIRCFF